MFLSHIHSQKYSQTILPNCAIPVVEVAEKHCPTVLSQAKVIEAKYKKIISLFGECQALYDGKSITDSEIEELGKPPLSVLCLLRLLLCFVGLSETKIKEFMTYYRDSFAWATVIPKMHMLEVHVIPWLKMWHIGFGLMGEQGAESIHTYFNSLKRVFHSTPDPVLRLRRMMNEHLLHIAPSNIAIYQA